MTETFNVPSCNATQTNPQVVHLIGDHSSSAQFFVTIGVLAFLYCTAMLVLYLGYQHVYKQSGRGPTVVRLATMPFCSLFLYYYTSNVTQPWGFCFRQIESVACVLFGKVELNRWAKLPSRKHTSVLNVSLVHAWLQSHWNLTEGQRRYL